MSLNPALLASSCPSHKVWEYFQLICSIPHPSYHEEALAQTIVNLLEGKGLRVWRDDVGNVLACKPATEGMEGRPGVILQGHIDMVPQKCPDSSHDFQRDPISLLQQDGWVMADGTTLGADNGIGVAAALAVLMSDDMVHGPLEALFTINEESGMEGAHGLQPGALNGDYLLNLDTEEEGELYVGCAGGKDVNAVVSLQLQPAKAGQVAYSLSLDGLRGGHSGLDINDQRGNAALLLTALLAKLPASCELASVDSGSVRNAIPRRAKAVLTVAEADITVLKALVAGFRDECCARFNHPGESFSLQLEGCEVPEAVLSSEQKKQLLRTLVALPNGPLEMCQGAPERVETSSNMGVIKTQQDQIDINILVRSFDDGSRDKTCEMIAAHLSPVAAVVCENEYPGWKPDLQSALLKQMEAIHLAELGEPAKIEMIHAGLECGLLGAKYPNWQMISFGPNITGAHSPQERVEVSTVDTMWRLLVATLASLN
ncbi:Xaa-His dipeptidase [Sinobacterium caligoides]|uniref:Cytosol non-specific dipeptidase n=1 Tax=Sinobacterium caligoides TaxID=933926 RepID=A0A3N2DYP0_9GAMM|nr:beta-Ala-His dipeptidase [Sinobacterium caligoides]ROS04904.1 Xaa-His dipeptidase [Sinobacterium caligoides]